MISGIKIIVNMMKRFEDIGMTLSEHKWNTNHS